MQFTFRTRSRLAQARLQQARIMIHAQAQVRDALEGSRPAASAEATGTR